MGWTASVLGEVGEPFLHRAVQVLEFTGNQPVVERAAPEVKLVFQPVPGAWAVELVILLVQVFELL